MKALAGVFDVVEIETAYGGQSLTYEPLGYAWLKLGGTRRREVREQGATRYIETVTAETRSDARLTPGRLLRFGGADWRIDAGEVVGGRVILNLERVR